MMNGFDDFDLGGQCEELTGFTEWWNEIQAEMWNDILVDEGDII